MVRVPLAALGWGGLGGKGVEGWAWGGGRGAQLTDPSPVCPSGEQGLPGFSTSGKC